MVASLVGVVVVSIVSVVDTVCVVNKEDNESPLQEMFSTTSVKEILFCLLYH